ncbi:hypothetical protein HPB48_001003 [Haemaphysalis longicornis]|uniref:Uncharacterized protein n=1 Tax=Haemaphysalis longicornis TaxID=44386 RepID=A0A9J6GWP6_HAELO|nr:hypothetical protein HPB48_001003 [Haemaphysalis longicornis]
MPFCWEPFEDVERGRPDPELRAGGPPQRMEPEAMPGERLLFTEETAKSWYENHQASLALWKICKDDLKRAFTHQYRQQRAEVLLQTMAQVQMNNHQLRVRSSPSDFPRRPWASEEKKVQTLLKGVKCDIFGGLFRNHPTTVSEFVTEATNIERALQASASHYHRLTGGPSVTTLAHNHRETLAAEPEIFATLFVVTSGKNLTLPSLVVSS